MRLYFIRHGETTCNLVNKHQGWGPIRLTERGREQAIAARAMFTDIHFDRYFASDLLRTKQTAELIFPDVFHSGGFEYDDNLREIDTGVFFGEGTAELYPLFGFGDEYLRRKRIQDLGVYGAESADSVKDRAAKFVARMEALAAEEEAPKKVAVVAHGAIIRAICYLVTGLPHDGISGTFNISLYNCSVTVLDIEPERGWRIIHINYTTDLL